VRLTPLEDRLTRLLAAIPLDAQQREGLSLAPLQASLRGRWRGNAHPGLGAALRRLGFQRRRTGNNDERGAKEPDKAAKQETSNDCNCPSRCTKGRPAQADVPVFRGGGPSHPRLCRMARGEEKVLHAEKVAHERAMGRDHDVWDVHTDKDRWWVVTCTPKPSCRASTTPSRSMSA
jgi:hypothetical protein